jgi:hypothetical protein
LICPVRHAKNGDAGGLPRFAEKGVTRQADNWRR